MLDHGGEGDGLEKLIIEDHYLQDGREPWEGSAMDDDCRDCGWGKNGRLVS